MKRELLRLLGVIKIQDGGSSKNRIATTKDFYKLLTKLSSQSLVVGKKKPEKDNNLYDIEVTQVDKDKKCMKIHIVGYRNKFDECGNFKSTVISYRLSASKNFMIQTKNR